VFVVEEQLQTFALVDERMKGDKMWTHSLPPPECLECLRATQCGHLPDTIELYRHELLAAHSPIRQHAGVPAFPDGFSRS